MKFSKLVIKRIILTLVYCVAIRLSLHRVKLRVKLKLNPQWNKSNHSVARRLCQRDHSVIGARGRFKCRPKLIIHLKGTSYSKNQQYSLTRDRFDSAPICHFVEYKAAFDKCLVFHIFGIFSIWK